MTQLALALAPAAPLDEWHCYHDPSRPGFASILLFNGSTKGAQHSFHLQQLDRQIARMRGADADVYLSQNEFFKPNRQAVSVWRLTSQFVDLDTYKVPRLKGKSPEFLREEILMLCDAACIPPPTVMVFSGRGIQAKWCLDVPVPRHAVPRWQAVQDALCDIFQPIGADRDARDVSRVLRLVGSVNQRSGQTAREVYRAQTPAMGGIRLSTGVIAYDFEDLTETLLPESRRAHELARHQRDEDDDAAFGTEQRRRAAVRSRLIAIDGGNAPKASLSRWRPLIASQLAWDRLNDIKRLCQLRGWAEGAPPGQRNMPMFLAACCLADAKVVRDIMPSLEALAVDIAPTWSAAQVRSCASAVLARAEAAQAGDTVIYEGIEVNPRYRFRNETMADWLQLTADEQRQMKTIIGADEARRRDRERKDALRREAGCMSRDDYELRAQGREAQARALRAAGMAVSEVAAKLGVTRQAVYGYLR